MQLSSGDHRNPVVAANAGTTVAAAWESDTGGPLQIRIRRIDDEQDRWLPIFDFDNQGGAAPDLAVAPDGTVHVAWTEQTTDGPLVVSATSAGDTSWTLGPHPNGVPITGADAVRIGLDGTGRLTMVVRSLRSDGRSTVVEATTRNGVLLQTPISTTAAHGGPPQLAVAADGTAVAAWRSDIPHVGIVAAVRQPGGAWTQTTSVAVSDDETAPTVVAEGGGAATVLWTSRSGDRATVEARRFDGVRWGAPVSLDRTDAPGDATTSGDAPAAAAVPDGMVAAWRLGGTIRTASRDASGTWSDPITRAGPADQVGGPALAVLPGAVASVGWDEVDHDLLRVRFAAPGGPSTCRDLSPANTEATDVRIAGGGAPTAVYTDLRHGRIMAVDLR